MTSPRTAALGLWAAATATVAAPPPQPDPPEGEQRLNRFQYVGTHNSYQRFNADAAGYWTLREQVDYFGHRHLEIDIRWRDALPPPPGFPDVVGNFLVSHFCGDAANPPGEPTVDEYLADLASCEAITGEDHSFVIVNFEVIVDPEDGYIPHACYDEMPTGNPPGAPNSAIEHWQWILQERVKAHIPQDRIYTPEEFITIDDQRWPSQQELLRRGKSIVFTASSSGFSWVIPPNPYYFPHIFFGHGQINLDTGAPLPADQNDVHLGVGDEFQYIDEGDQFISVLFPFGNLCGFEGPNFFYNGLSAGYTFPTTYCAAKIDYLLEPAVHPPNPTFVTSGVAVAVPLGTHLLPHVGGDGLLAALDRTAMHEQLKGASRLEIIIDEGVYDLSDGSAPTAIGQTVRLESSGGVVTITN